jgi:predicted transcriptional regulator
MEQYFKDVVNSLTYEDISVLSTLYDNDAPSSIKSIKIKEVQEKSGHSEAIYRKIIYRLMASQFIKSTHLNRQQKIFLTEYGITAVNKSLEEVEAI